MLGHLFNQKNGSVLVMVIIVIVILMTISTTILLLQGTDTKTILLYGDEIENFYANNTSYVTIEDGGGGEDLPFFGYLNSDIADEIWQLYKDKAGSQGKRVTLETNPNIEFKWHNGQGPHEDYGKLWGLHNALYSDREGVISGLKSLFEPEHGGWYGTIDGIEDIDDIQEGDHYSNLDFNLIILGSENKKVYIDGHIQISVKQNNYWIKFAGGEQWVVDIDPD